MLLRAVDHHLKHGTAEWLLRYALSAPVSPNAISTATNVTQAETSLVATSSGQGHQHRHHEPSTRRRLAQRTTARRPWLHISTPVRLTPRPACPVFSPVLGERRILAVSLSR